MHIHDKQLALGFSVAEESIPNKTKRTETFGERADRNIITNSTAFDGSVYRTKTDFSEADDLAEWHLRHLHPRSFH